jgi:hypothetical protein
MNTNHITVHKIVARTVENKQSLSVVVLPFLALAGMLFLPVVQMQTEAVGLPAERIAQLEAEGRLLEDYAARFCDQLKRRSEIRQAMRDAGSQVRITLI